MPIIFLIIMSAIAAYLLLCIDWGADEGLRTTIIIALLGSSLAVFQFWVSEINTGHRNKSQMRYNEYKHVFSLIEAVPDVLNEEMLKDQEINPHSLLSTLVNKVNGITSFLNSNDYLFPGLIGFNETKALDSILSTIINRTDKLRLKLSKIIEEHDELPSVFIAMQERTIWNNEMIDHLKELHSAKYGFYKRLVKYL